ncbi:MAG: hypothetical protein OEV45_05605 [Desulfobacteraceae bacterium]|nr:hypothetical protein [Desulfobacteraceae bacterium]
MSGFETLTRPPCYLRQAGNASRRSRAKQEDGISPAFPRGKQNKDLKQKAHFILPEFCKRHLSSERFLVYAFFIEDVKIPLPERCGFQTSPHSAKNEIRVHGV